MRLRWRVLFALVVTALVPIAGMVYWAQNVFLEQAREQATRLLSERHAGVSDALARRLEDDREVLASLCRDDDRIDQLMLEIATDRFGPAREEAMHERVPRWMAAYRFDVLFIVQLSGSDRGRILGAGHHPDHVGAKDPSLAAALTRDAPGNAFVRDVRVRQGSITDQRSLLAGCVTPRRDGVQIGLLGGRALSTDGTLFSGLEAGLTLSLVENPPSPTQVIERFDHVDGSAALYLISAEDEDALGAQRQSITRAALVAGGVGLCIAFLLGWFLAGRVTRDVDAMIAFAKKIGGVDLESTVTEHRGDEMGRLQRELNSMARKLGVAKDHVAKEQKRALRAERIAAWRDVGRLVAHEIKNPLSPIQVSIETMRKTYAKQHPDFDEIFEESTVAILEEVQRMKVLVSEFSQFARLPRPKVRDISVDELVGHVAALHQNPEVSLKMDLAVTGSIRADREQLTQVLVNLVQNAQDAALAVHGGRGAEVVVSARDVEEERVEVRIEDNGPGVSMSDRERIFEPYFTTKSTGTGLGLAVVHRIVDDHGGTIVVEDGRSGGAAFVVTVPRAGPRPGVEESRTDMSVPLTARSSVIRPPDEG